MASPTEITTQQLSRLIGTPDCPVIIDVRIDEDFDADPFMIPTAKRRAHASAQTLAPSLLGQRIVVICHKGLKLSQGTAAILRANGVQTETLLGGQVAWRDANLPLIDPAKITTINDQGQSVWVTRHRPKIDRIACPWFIRRFVDPSAQFLFVEPSQVQNVAEKFNATPFDIEDTFWSHRGDLCTFDVLLAEFGLQTDALARLATIIRGADTNRHDLAPEAAGLMAASLGLSRMYRDDLEQLDAGMALYDAFYRWARDATSEGHDWLTASTKPKGPSA